MKMICTILLLILLAGCGIEKPDYKSALSYKTIGYNQYNTFIFSVRQSAPSGDLMRQDTIGLFCSDMDFAPNKDQLLAEWPFLTRKPDGNYRVIPESSLGSEEGILLNDSVLFMHPPRHNYLKITQFAPYPYFKNLSKTGNSWTWDFKIGPYWAIDSLYPIKDHAEVFNIVYTFADIAILPSKYGPLQCYHITANSTSHFGISTASYYLNFRYGLVQFYLKTTNGQHYDFTLIEKLEGVEKMSYNKEFMRAYHEKMLKKLRQPY